MCVLHICFETLRRHTFFEQLSVDRNRKLVDEEWFHGILPREEVSPLLVNDGDFIVRESQKNGESSYVLSCMWQKHKHFKIQKTDQVSIVL